MSINRIFFVLSLLLLSGSSYAIQCKRASNTVEKTICESAELLVLDSELNSAYQTVTHFLGSSDERANFVASQRYWLSQRNACAERDSIASCLEGSIKSRIQQLKILKIPGSEFLIVPLLGVVDEIDHADYQLVKIIHPTSNVASEVNGIMGSIISEARGRQSLTLENCSYTEKTYVTHVYATAKFLSIFINTARDGCGMPHGSFSGRSIIFSFEKGYISNLSDVFSATALPKMLEECRRQLYEEKESNGSSKVEILEQAQGLESSFVQKFYSLSAWRFHGDMVEVEFDPYDVGSYAEGGYQCVFPAKLVQANLVGGLHVFSTNSDKRDFVVVKHSPPTF